MTASHSPAAPTQEINRQALGGWPMLMFNLLLILAGIALLLAGPRLMAPFVIVAGFIMLSGHFTLQPNESRVLILFGKYCGTVRESGFFWANPFYARIRSRIAMSGIETGPVQNQMGRGVMPQRALGSKISLRARNFISEKLKVNDKRGNPVEIAAVIVWKVTDTARAAFDVEDFESYVQIQSESAIRHIASLYNYDSTEEDRHSLRDSADEVAAALQRELDVRLDKAGLAIVEARLTHLAYAPEIAQAMLRVQQAEAVIAARFKIVHGAVSMVQLALSELADKNVVHFDDERKASMVSNLLVVLCGENEVTPVINTGTLYS